MAAPDVANLSDKRLNGTVSYGGYGCPASAPIPRAPGSLTEDDVVVLQRGPVGDPSAPEAACFPGEKAAMAKAAGYDAVIITNRHFGSATADTAYCGSGGYPAEAVGFPTICTTHAGLHALFGQQPNYATDYSGTEPRIGDRGAVLDAQAFFNDWGYVHLYSGTQDKAGKYKELDTYAIDEAHDPTYAEGYGDLSVHEVAVSETNAALMYFSYYSGGFRAVKIEKGQLVEKGRYIDAGGSNFWGVQVFQQGGQEYVAASDRDHGLYIFRYTGG